MAACRNHPDRPGIGVCMRCRAVVCAGCSTRVDGINHCPSCLKAMSRRPTANASGFEVGTLASVGVVGVACLLLFGVLWLLQGTLAP